MGGDVLACLEALEKVSDPNGGPRIAADAHMKAALRNSPAARDDWPAAETSS